MSYPQEVQAIFDLTLDLLEKDEWVNRHLLSKLRELCTTGKWENETAITEAIEQLITAEESTNA